MEAELAFGNTYLLWSMKKHLWLCSECILSDYRPVNDRDLSILLTVGTVRCSSGVQLRSHMLVPAPPLFSSALEPLNQLCVAELVCATRALLRLV